MVCILNTRTDPYFNAAAEEFLLKHFENDCFMLWRNRSSVFVGKHQNTLAEINYTYITKNNIPVIRRLSGGGTVFHDEGNLNFSFITKVENNKAIQFHKFLEPIQSFLSSINVNANINPRNNLFIGENKISGTAAHIFKNRVIHHGTLLFNSSEKAIIKSLEVNTEKYTDKSVKSVRSPITNISSHLKQNMKIDEFTDILKNKLKTHFNCSTEYSFSDRDVTKIENLSINKYQTWEWNFGYSPAYYFKNTAIINDVRTIIQLEIKKGIIENAEISGEKSSQKIKKLIIGLHHQEHDLSVILEKYHYEYWHQYFF